MRVLHIVKTSDGAHWAVQQASELRSLGVDVHVALPSLEGRLVPDWRRSGATIHLARIDWPARRPWRVGAVAARARDLVRRVRPDVIHSHFFGTTMIVRRAMSGYGPVPVVFQVPGPLHLEHAIYRQWDIRSAGADDWWIASSRAIERLYTSHGVPAGRVFMSYYGIDLMAAIRSETVRLRRKLAIADGTFVVGNVNYMYPPKWYLGHRAGIKAHEHVIHALAELTRRRRDTIGVLVGGPHGRDDWYERRLRKLAERAAGDRIRMVGRLPRGEAVAAWKEFDCALHIPVSENCGGVVEPLANGVPVVAAAVGGLPEVILPAQTGTLIPDRSPASVATALEHVLDNRAHHRALAAEGARLVHAMFDVRRTAREVLGIYRSILSPGTPRPAPFDGAEYLRISDSTPVAAHA
ncbi:MAG: glycosyltransferase family 4 protein [Vicinamibacterales bacterium]